MEHSAPAATPDQVSGRMPDGLAKMTAWPPIRLQRPSSASLLSSAREAPSLCEAGRGRGLSGSKNYKSGRPSGS